MRIFSKTHSASLQALVAAGGNSLAAVLGTSTAAHHPHHAQQQQPQQQQQQSTGVVSAQAVVSGSLGSFVNNSPTPGGDLGGGPKDSKKVEIPELIVGAILGK